MPTSVSRTTSAARAPSPASSSSDEAETRMETDRTRRWAALVLYVVAIYASLPFGPRLGTRILRSAPGGWLLGPGLPLIAVAGAAVLVVVLWRRRAPAWAYAALVSAA